MMIYIYKCSLLFIVLYDLLADFGQFRRIIFWKKISFKFNVIPDTSQIAFKNTQGTVTPIQHLKFETVVWSLLRRLRISFAYSCMIYQNRAFIC